MVLSLRYGDLSGAVSQSNKLADELDQYCDALSRKVQQKMYSVEGGTSNALGSADYYVNQKVRDLRTRAGNSRSFSARMQTLLDTAKRVDEDVARTIRDNRTAFFEKNPELQAPWYQQAFVSFICNMEKVPVIGWLIRGGEAMGRALDELGDNIKFWWKCGGGKELVMNCLDIVIKVASAVLAVITAVTAVIAVITATVVTAGMVIFAVAACVAAVIAAVNAGTNIVTSAQAIIASRNNDPAMAKIYSERDTLAQTLRETNFHDREKNRASNRAACAIEITEAVAGVVMLVQSIGKTVGSFLSKNGVGFAFKELARGSDGKLTSKVTLKSIWRGTKALILNEKLTTSTAQGLRTTLFKNVWESIRYQGTLFKMALRDPVRWMNAKEAGDMGLFKNIMEKMKLEFWHLKNDAFQFREFNMKNLEFNLGKVETLAKFGKGILTNIEMVLKGLDHEDNKGLLRRAMEKYSSDIFSKNSAFKTLNDIGGVKLITGLDQSNTLSDFTGAKKGIIQKLQDISKNINELFNIPVFELPSFQELHPYYECALPAPEQGRLAYA